jgi:NADH:ubiquinone oxidoreductase subunit F (NADH-binding)
MAINQIWDFDTIFPGGSHSPALADFLAQLNSDFDTLEATADTWPPQCRKRTRLG